MCGAYLYSCPGFTDVTGKPEYHSRDKRTDTHPGHAPRTGHCFFPRASQVALVVKNLPANAGDARDVGSIPELRRSPGVGNGNPLQYSCLENAMDSGAWQARVHGVTKSWTQLSDGAHTAHMCEHTQLPYVAGPQEPLYRKAKKGTHADCYHSDGEVCVEYSCFPFPSPLLPLFLFILNLPL